MIAFRGVWLSTAVLSLAELLIVIQVVLEMQSSLCSNPYPDSITL